MAYTFPRNLDIDRTRLPPKYDKIGYREDIYQHWVGEAIEHAMHHPSPRPAPILDGSQNIQPSTIIYIIVSYEKTQSNQETERKN
jgi:hypothetical protein